MSKNQKKNPFDIGENLELRIVKFFTKLGFDVKRNPRGKGPDITAIKKIDKHTVKLIFQCKAHVVKKETKTYPNLEKIVDEYATKLRKVRGNKAILVLSGYKTPSGFDAELVLKEDRVAIWTDKYIDYYEDLFSKIGSYATYQMLADLGLHIQFSEEKHVPALRFEQNKRVFYIFGIQPGWLLKAATVSRRIDPELGPTSYQRLLTKKRVVEEIPEFLSDDNWVLPNSIICATNKGIGVKFEKKVITLPSKVGTIWVMDGQHRLYSFANVKNDELRENVLIVCTLFDSKHLGEKSEAIQAQAFIDLNLHAKKVNPALIAELKNLIGILDLPLKIVMRLRETALFKGKIKSYSESRGTISLVTFATNAAMKELLRYDGPILKRRFTEVDVDKAAKKVEDISYKVIKEYFTIVSQVFKKEWGSTKYSLTTDKGIRGLLKLLQKIFQYLGGNYDSDQVKKILLALKTGGPDLTREAFLNQFAGEGGANKLASQWAATITNSIRDFDPNIQQNVVDQKNFRRGEKVKAREKLKEWFKSLDGDVRGVLAYIDETTFEYLQFINPGRLKSLRIIFGEIRPGSREKIRAMIKEMREKGYKVILTQAQKLVNESGTLSQKGSYFHLRYLASDRYCVELNTDLKDDAIANSENTKTLYKWSNPPQLETFEDHWERARSGVQYTFNWE